MEETSSKKYCLRWDRHAANMASEAECFFQDEAFLDCTLYAEGQCIQAHKLILSAASPYLANVLRVANEKHPILIFNNIRFSDLKALISFIYSGTVDVEEAHIESFLNAAQALLVRGLSEGLSDRQQKSSPKLVPPRRYVESAAPLASHSKFEDCLTKPDTAPVKNPTNAENYVVKSWKVNSVEDINGKINKTNQKTAKTDRNFMYKKFKLEKPVQPEPKMQTKVEKENIVVDEHPILVEPKIEVMEEDDTNGPDPPEENALYCNPPPKVVDVPVPMMMCSASLREPDGETWQNLSTHISETNSSDLELPCWNCRKKYKSRYALNRHVLYECGKARKSFSCDECGKKVTRQDTLQKHKLIHLVQHLKQEEDSGSTPT